MTLSISTFSLMTLSMKELDSVSFYAKCRLCKVLLMLSVANKSFMLSVVMLNVIRLSDMAPVANVIKLFLT